MKIGRSVKLCQHVNVDGPRAGQVCSRRYMTGDGCEKHRPPRPDKRRSPEARKREQARHRERRARAAARVGVPEGWTV